MFKIGYDSFSSLIGQFFWPIGSRTRSSVSDVDDGLGLALVPGLLSLLEDLEEVVDGLVGQHAHGEDVLGEEVTVAANPIPQTLLKLLLLRVALVGDSLNIGSSKTSRKSTIFEDFASS